ncbi:MAG TPA: hypothetical protein V6C86_17235 [Oculatellaceae cyanobacterium]
MIDNAREPKSAEKGQPLERSREAASRNMMHEVHHEHNRKAPSEKREHDPQHLHFDNSIYGHDHQHSKPEAQKTLPAEDKATQEKNVNQMLDSNTSPEDKIKLASKMYEHGQRSFTDKDGHKYDINETNAGGRKVVGVFTNDQNGHSQNALRGVVEKDGSVSQQQDNTGKKVDYENDWSKKNNGGGLRKAPEIEKGTDPKDGSQFERRKDGHGGTIESHSGDKPDQNYTKTDDGKGNSLVQHKDGTGYSRMEKPDGSYSEAHFGPNPSDSYVKTGDGKGNDVVTRSDDRGNMMEQHTFQNNPKANFTREQHADKSQTITDATGNKTFISADGNTTTYQGTDGKTVVRQKNDNGYNEKHTGPNKDDNYSIDYKNDGQGNTRTVRDDGQGNTVESRTFPDQSNNYKKETFADKSTRTTDAKGNVTTKSADGKVETYKGADGTGYTRTKTGDNSYTEDHTGPKPEDNYKVDHSVDQTGTTKDKYSFADKSKDYTKEVTKDGHVTMTDSVGLKVDMVSGSEQWQKDTYNKIESLPAAERKLLADKGIHYTLASKMSDIDPKLATEQPRGWPAGKTWNDADGGYMPDRKQINVAENTNAGPSNRTQGVIDHESGHAVDDALGRPSHDAKFEEAYKKDIANIKNPFQMTYLRQTGDAGKEETYAEVYGALRGSSANPAETQTTLATFPNVAKVIQEELDGLPK